MRTFGSAVLRRLGWMAGGALVFLVGSWLGFASVTADAREWVDALVRAAGLAG